MEITRDFLRIFIFIFGPLVLVSYAYGLSHADDKAALWGGIPSSWQVVIVPFMFVAAVGFLMYWWIALYNLDESVISSFRWPWGESDGKGLSRLLLAFALFLIPSAFWLESTIFHISNEYSWTPVLVIGILFLVSLGNVLLGLLAFGAYQDGVEGSGLMVVGSIMLAIQCILNDFIIWSIKFPW